MKPLEIVPEVAPWLPSNSRIKLPVRLLTAVASATAAPSRPAAYAGR